MPTLVHSEQFTVHRIKKTVNRKPSTVNWCRRHHGFTLIELLVVISLLVLTSGLIVAALNTFGRSQGLKNAALIVKNDIRFVQNKASSGDKNTGADSCGTTSTLGGWFVRVSNGGTSYKMAGDCLSSTNTETEFKATTVNFPSGISVSGISYGVLTPSEVYIFFRPLAYDVTVHGTMATPPDFYDSSGKLNNPIGTGSDLVITLIQQVGGGTYQIIVKPSGEVNEKKP